MQGDYCRTAPYCMRKNLRERTTVCQIFICVRGKKTNVRESVCVHVRYSFIFVASHCSLLYIVIVCISLFAVVVMTVRPLPQ